MNNMNKTTTLPLMTPQKRLFLGGAIITLGLCLMGAALTIPFLFESPSMFYKFGSAKLLLRTGKMIGILAGVLMLMQLLLAGRLKFLDRIFSLPLLYRFHRINAYAICLLAIVHPIFIFIPDDLYMIPVELKYWPEWVGALLLLLILLQTVFSRWRKSFRFSHPAWLLMHRLIGIFVIIALVVHVLYVSETFEHDGMPQQAVFFAAGIWVVCWLWVRYRSLKVGQRRGKVASVEKAGKDAYKVVVKLDAPEKFRYAPGQFVFVSFASKHLSPEVHPFTLSSSPSRPDSLELTIRNSGDWTGQVGALQAGDTAFIQGPFGSFSYLAEAPALDIVMIAGGIGITPMLSMLRHLRDQNDHREIVLIWCNRSQDRLFAGGELEALEQQLTHFKWVPIFTREKGEIGHFGRINQHFLSEHLAEIQEGSVVYVCGPPAMIRQVRKDLMRLGVASDTIKQEAFGF